MCVGIFFSSEVHKIIVSLSDVSRPLDNASNTFAIYCLVDQPLFIVINGVINPKQLT